jgi:hypothetical protein
VIDHEAALLDPNTEVVLKFGSQASGVVETEVCGVVGRQTSSRWLFSRKNDWVVQLFRSTRQRL